MTGMIVFEISPISLITSSSTLSIIVFAASVSLDEFPVAPSIVIHLLAPSDSITDSSSVPSVFGIRVFSTLSSFT
jgi:hypothetical protein